MKRGLGVEIALPNSTEIIMSAFIVGHDHIDALLTFAIDRRVSYWNAQARNRVTITRENVKTGDRIVDRSRARPAILVSDGHDQPESAPKL